MIAAAKSKRTYILVAALTLVLCTTVLVLSPIDQRELSRTYSSDQFSTLFLLGEVQHVLAGDLGSAMYLDEDVSHVALALGAGALGSIDRTGELLVMAGKAYIKPSDPTTNYKLETSSRIMTPFCFGVEEGAKPAAMYVLENKEKEGYRISRLYDALSRDQERLFAVFGVVQFREIQLTAIKLAPIYGETITAPENAQKYFHTLAPIKDRVAIFVGVVNNPNRDPQTTYNATMENRIFYVNPADEATSELRSHTHVLITSSSTYAPSHLDSDEELLGLAQTFPIVDVGHLLTQSTLQRAAIVVYSIDRIINIARIDTPVTTGAAGFSPVRDDLTSFCVRAPAVIDSGFRYLVCAFSVHTQTESSTLESLGFPRLSDSSRDYSENACCHG